MSPTAVVRKEVKPSKCYLYFVAVIVNIMAFSAGVSIAWTSPSIPKMNGMEDPIHNPLPEPITHEEESWITALLTLGISLGPFAFGYMTDKIGSKKTLIFSSIPVALSFMVQAFANDVAYFYMARLMGGFGLGAAFTVIPMYIGEIAEDGNRGALGCILPNLINAGILFTYAAGPFLTLTVFNLINVVPPLAFAALATIFVPNSPYFLIQQNKKSQAEISLRVFRGRPSLVDVDKEMTMIIDTVNDSLTARSRFSEIFKTKGTRKGISITCGLMLFQQFTGISVILAYMQIVFDAAESSLDAHMSVIVIGCVQVLAGTTTFLFIDRFGRKILLYVSLTGTCLCNCLMATFFYLKENEYDVNSYNWVPILALVLFIVSYNLGLAPVPWALVGELFPPSLKAKAATLTTFVCHFLAFTTNVAFPYVKIFVGFPETFWFFSIFCAVGLFFAIFYVPETKGKSLHDILIMLNS